MATVSAVGFLGGERPQAKTGTTTFLRIMQKLSEHLGLRLRNIYGMVREIDPDTDIVLLPHSLIERLPKRRFRAVCVARDPRRWLERLGGKSYQANLLERSRDEAFELGGYAGCTL